MTLIITISSLVPSYGGASPDTLGIQKGNGTSNPFREVVDLTINDIGLDDNDTESMLIILMNATEKVTGIQFCKGDDLEDMDQQIACARKQMKWADKNQVSKRSVVHRQIARDTLHTYFKWCYLSCGVVSCKDPDTRTRCLKICCPYRDQMISIGHTNPFWDCEKKRYYPDPKDYNPCGH